MRYAVVIEPAGSGFSAYVPDLPGCIATGTTMAETERRIAEAAACAPSGIHPMRFCGDAP